MGKSKKDKDLLCYKKIAKFKYWKWNVVFLATCQEGLSPYAVICKDAVVPDTAFVPGVKYFNELGPARTYFEEYVNTMIFYTSLSMLGETY